MQKGNRLFLVGLICHVVRGQPDSHTFSSVQFDLQLSAVSDSFCDPMVAAYQASHSLGNLNGGYDCRDVGVSEHYRYSQSFVQGLI